jgi:hypothetical protein
MFYGRENIGLPGGSLKDMAGTRRLELLTSTVSKLVNLTCKKLNMNELLNVGAGRGVEPPRGCPRRILSLILGVLQALAPRRTEWQQVSYLLIDISHVLVAIRCSQKQKSR